MLFDDSTAESSSAHSGAASALFFTVVSFGSFADLNYVEVDNFFFCTSGICVEFVDIIFNEAFACDLSYPSGCVDVSNTVITATINESCLKGAY